MPNPDHNARLEFEKRAERVHCMLGFPLDMVTMDDVLDEIFEATRTRQRLFISTVNLNFVTQAQTDQDFMESLRCSNLCVADGMAVKLIGTLLGMPIPERVAGSDILSAIWEQPSDQQETPLNVFFFGGTEEAGRLACDALNRQPSKRTVCVGNLCPGYGSVEDMSSEAIIRQINAAEPDFLVVSLGAQKGQAWIMQNMDKLEAPVISHLGATINFLAGTLKRAPAFWQRAGLEWLWRIKEEPALARRYWCDFLVTLRLATTRILPLAIHLQYCKWRWSNQELSLIKTPGGNVNLKRGPEMHINDFQRKSINELLSDESFGKSNIEISLDEVNWLGTHSLGNLLLLSEKLKRDGGKLELIGQPRSVAQEIHLSGLGDLLPQT